MWIFDPGRKAVKWYASASENMPERSGEFQFEPGSQAWPLDLNKSLELGDKIGYVLKNGAGVFSQPVTEITPAVKNRLPDWLEIDEHSARLVEAGLKHFPQAPHFILCETAFFTSLPERAAAYALPEPYYSKDQRRGAGGLSHAWINRAAGTPGRLVSIHLCDQPTVAAIRDRAPLETSAGLSTLEGLTGLSTCGDLDPTIVLELLRQGRSAQEVRGLLAEQSGFQVFAPGAAALDETINKEGLPIEMLKRGLLKSAGAALAALGGADCIAVAAEQPEKWRKLIESLKEGLAFLDVNTRFLVLEAPRGRVLLDTMKYW
jgi:acetate kinase